MILGNYANVNRNIARNWGVAFSNPVSNARPWILQGINFAEDASACEMLEYSGFPNGYNTEYSYSLPMHPGGIGMVNAANGSGSLAATGSLGRNGSALISAMATVSATGQTVVSGAASVSASGSVSANLNATKAAAATISSSASVSATRSAKGNVTASLSGSCSISATRYALGELACAITPFTELSPESLAAAVWNALAADYNDAGTMGEKLNGAGSAGNPWTEIIESGMSAAEVLRVIASALAGKVSGAGSGTETFKGLDGTTNRIISTVDNDGNRTAVTVDGA